MLGIGSIGGNMPMMTGLCDNESLGGYGMTTPAALPLFGATAR